MADIKQVLLKGLLELESEDLKSFQWYLYTGVEGFSKIPKSQLEKADRHDIVDLIVQKHGFSRAPDITVVILKEMGQNQLAEELQKNVVTELKRIQQFAVDVTLDPDTAHPNLILSDDGKQVTCGDIIQNLPENPKRFTRVPYILGKKGFSSGRFYYEVQVRGKTMWTLGVVKESINRNVWNVLRPQYGIWTVALRNGNQYQVGDDSSVPISLKEKPQKVGVFVDYEEGLVSFYDVENWSHIYSFTGQSFTEKLYPFFDPFNNAGGKNSAPLIISLVSKSE